MRFEWDPDKDRENRKKHGVAFEEAATVFQAEGACLELFDELHSNDEERFITMGPIQSGLILVVWTERDGGAIRLISARHATPRERDLYLRRMETL